MFNGKVHYKWPFSIAMQQITRWYLHHSQSWLVETGVASSEAQRKRFGAAAGPEKFTPSTCGFDKDPGRFLSVKQCLIHIIYPLVICYITMERSTLFFMGKSTISMAMFNSYVSHCQRVYIYNVIMLLGDV